MADLLDALNERVRLRAEVKRIAAERDELYAQVTRLQERCNKYQEEERGLRYQVNCFHEKFGHARPRKITPAPVRVPLSYAANRFFQAMDCLSAWQPFPSLLNQARERVEQWLVHATDPQDVFALKLDLPEFVCALAQLDYWVESIRISLGVDSRPIAAAVHRANMDSMPAKSYVALELEKQGWSPTKRWTEGLP